MPSSSLKQNPLAWCLLFLLFAPLYGRMFFPKVRDTEALGLIQSFSDPQMLATYLLFFVGTLVVFVKYRYLDARALRLFGPWLVIALLIALSLFQSSRVLHSLWRLFEVLALLLGVIAFYLHVRDQRWLETGRVLFVLFSFYVLAFGLNLLLDPSAAWTNERYTQRLGAVSDDLMMDPATLGPVSGLVFNLALLSWLAGRSSRAKGAVLKLALAVLALVFCLLSLSRTGYLVLLSGSFILLYFSWRWRWSPLNPYLCLLVAMPILVIFLAATGELNSLFTEYVSRGYGTDAIAKLGGRSEIWDWAADRILESPALGYGYFGYFNIFKLSNHGHLHNAWLELAVGVGLPAVIIATVWQGALCYNGWSLSRNERPLRFGQQERKELLSACLIITAALVNSVVSAGFAYYSWPLIALLAGSVQLAVLRQPKAFSGHTALAPVASAARSRFNLASVTTRFNQV